MVATATAPEIQVGQELLEDLSLGEIMDLEEVGQISMSAFTDGGTLPFRAVVALAWIVKRRDDAAFTFDDAKGLKAREMADIFAPTPAVPLEPLKKARRGSS
jgi:hypothetical protein